MQKTSLLLSTATALLLPPLINTAQADTSFELYGFAQFDYIQDFNRVNPDWEASLRPSRIPTEDGEFGGDGQAIFSVRQSRFGVRSEKMVGGKNLKVNFEFDLYGVGDDAGQTTMRLRHFYGEWGQLLAGQTYSLFMDIDMFPNVIDYWGPSGMVFLRNPQVRWTFLSGDNNLAIALENPSNDIDTGEYDRIYPDNTVQGDQELPDASAQWRMNQPWGHLQLGGILRKVGYESTSSPDGDPSGSEIGWGLNASSNMNVATGTIRASVVYGEGIASYMNDGGVDMAPDDFSSDPGEVVPLLGIVAYYDHRWNDQYSSAIGYSFTEVDNLDGQTGDAFEKGEYASVNLLYAPDQNLLFGSELLWGKRTDNDGDSGTDTRLQFTVKYSFSTGNIL